MVARQAKPNLTHAEIRAPGATASGVSNALIIEKTVVLLLFILLVAAVSYILKPFVTALLFGTILAIAMWPAKLWLSRLGLSSGLAAAFLMIALLVLVLLPVALAAPGLADEVMQFGDRLRDWLSSLRTVPAWISSLPVIGEKLANQLQLALGGSPESKQLIASFAEPLRKFFTDAAIGLASSVVQLALSLVVAATLWVRGSALAENLHGSLEQLGGSGLAAMTSVAAGAVKGVFYGIVGTALLQGGMMMAGLYIAGVPAAAPLGFVTFVLAVTQVGSPFINLVWAGAAWWLFSNGGASLAMWFLIAWGILIAAADNLLKPWLIGARIDMPVTLVMLGVFGGFISFGFLGLFIGPTVLAIAYQLLAAWRRRGLAQH